MTDNDSEYDKKVKQNLIALLYLFDNKPHLLAHYLLHYDSLKKDFRNKLADNAFLAGISADIQNGDSVIKPYFTSLEHMQTYYSTAFHLQKQKDAHLAVLQSANDHEALMGQLRVAVEHEDYAKASRIKKYMEDLGYTATL